MLGLKKGGARLNQLRERNRQRTEGRAGRRPAVVIRDVDLPWGQAGEKREDCWIWTAVIQIQEAEADGSRWVDFEVGDRSEGPFLRLYERLPEAPERPRDGFPPPASLHSVFGKDAIAPMLAALPSAFTFVDFSLAKLIKSTVNKCSPPRVNYPEIQGVYDGPEAFQGA